MKACIIGSVSAVVFMAMVVGGILLWEYTHQDESISGDTNWVFTPYFDREGWIQPDFNPPDALRIGEFRIDCSDCADPNVMLHIHDAEQYDIGISIDEEDAITIVCDDIDTSDWLETTGPLVDRLDRTDATIKAMAECLLAMGEAQLIMHRKVSEIHAVICTSPELAPAVDWYTSDPTTPIGTYYIYEAKTLIDVSDPNDELITYAPEPGPWVLLKSCAWCGMAFGDMDVGRRREHGRGCEQ